MDLEQFKDNQKTTYLYSMYKKLLVTEAVLLEMAKDPAFVEMSKADLEDIAAQKETLMKQMTEIVEGEKKEEEFPNEIVLEVRAGAGGEEASLFAEELALMYRKYAANRGWAVSVVDESRSTTGGYKEATFEIRG